jgi:hypothetical protein
MRRKFAPLLVLLAAAACASPEKEQATASRPAPAAGPTAPAKPAAPADSLATFTWQDEACENVGSYRAGAYTEQQLRATYHLVDFPGVLTHTTVFRLEEYTDAHFAKAGRDLRREYDSLATGLRQADVVPTAFWRQIQQLRLRELDENYQLARFALAGYHTPASLLHNAYSSSCRQYAEALASTDTAVVLHAWRQLIDEQKRHNGAPELLEERFIQEAASPDRLRYAKLQLMTFGWYNCAISHTKYSDLHDRYQLQQRYHQLFKSVKSECEDVD